MTFTVIPVIRKYVEFSAVAVKSNLRELLFAFDILIYAGHKKSKITYLAPIAILEITTLQPSFDDGSSRISKFNPIPVIVVFEEVEQCDFVSLN